MPAYNFKVRFVDMVEKGIKRQTIRCRRKDDNNPRPGHLLCLYTGQRTKRCRKIGEGRCLSVEEVEIYETNTYIAGKRLVFPGDIEFARAEGFESVKEYYEFFKGEYGLPAMELLLIKWDPLRWR